MSTRSSWLLVCVVPLLGSACGESRREVAAPITAAPAPSAPAPTPSAPTPTAPTAPAPPTASPSQVLYGDIYTLSRTREGEGEGPATLLLEIEPAARPEGPVVAYAETHHSHWEFRELEVLPALPYPTAVLVTDTGHAIDLSECAIRTARRLHAQSVSDDEGEEGEAPVEGTATTFLALELSGCPGGLMGVVGVPLASVSAHRLRRDLLTERAPLELVDLVRDQDMAFDDVRVPAADFRALSLPQYNITIVAGEFAWVIRDGRVLNEPAGAWPSFIVEAGPSAFFEVDVPSEGWSTSLDCFHPTYDAGSCEIIDASGTPTNVRAAPSGRAAVVTTVTQGTTLPADDHVGSWYRLLTTPPGWAHESGLHCTELPRHPAPCR